MHPLKVSAQFAAFVWYTKYQGTGPAVEEKARRFARKNWVLFLPSAHIGLGQLLIRVAQIDKSSPRKRKARPGLTLAS